MTPWSTGRCTAQRTGRWGALKAGSAARICLPTPTTFLALNSTMVLPLNHFDVRSWEGQGLKNWGWRRGREQLPNCVDFFIWLRNLTLILLPERQWGGPIPARTCLEHPKSSEKLSRSIVLPWRWGWRQVLFASYLCLCYDLPPAKQCQQLWQCLVLLLFPGGPQHGAVSMEESALKDFLPPLAGEYNSKHV